MPGTTVDRSAEQLFQQRLGRLRTAVALGTPDRVPVAPNGPAWPARALGLPLSALVADAVLSYRTVIDAFAGLGDIDAIQSPNFHASVLGLKWLSRVKLPGRELPDDALWQVAEAEVMQVADYEAIVERGWAPWLADYYRERLPGALESFQAAAPATPAAIAECRARGVVPFSPVAATIPYEYFCGGRSLREFMLDLHRRPDVVQAAADAAMPALVDEMRATIRRLGLIGLWIAGWRSASEFIAPKQWHRFVFPYIKPMVEAAIEEGAIPVLHFDANWDRDLECLKELPKARCVLALDGRTDIFKAKQVLGEHMCIMGDVPPRMLTLGTPHEVRAYCRRLIEEVGPAGFILASGCDVPVDAKYENVKAMVESVMM